MTTLFVTHGALGSAAQMQPIAEAFGAIEQLTVIVLEFPGHGQSPLSDGQQFGIDIFVDVLAKAVHQFGGEKPLLFGYSMGGYVGLSLEARAPGTFGGILTLGTKFDWNVDSAEREAARLNPAVLTEKVPKFAAQLAERHSSVGGWEVVLTRTAQLMRESGRSPVLTPERLALITTPVTLVVGSRDDVVSVHESEQTLRYLPNATLHVLPDIPHPIERVPMECLVPLVRQLVVNV